MRVHEAWSIAICMKKHMTEEKFDAFKFSFSLPNCTAQNVALRKDVGIYARMAKRFQNRDDFIVFCLGNILDGKEYVGSFTEDSMLELQRRWDSLSRIYSEDLKKLTDLGTLDQILKSKDGGIPLVMTVWARGDISIETVAILNHLTGFINISDKKVSDRLLWPELALRVKKYGAFLTELDWESFKNLTLRVFSR